MPVYLGGPAWPELDAALAGRDFAAALALAERDNGIDVAERQLVIGICRAMFHQSDQAVSALVESLQGFGRSRPHRAAMAALFLGRMHHFVHDSPRVANGWFARARRLVADRPLSLEYAVVSLPLPGCDMVDVDRLHEAARRALATADRLGEPDLEAKALADLGTAQVSRAQVEAGMTLLDEAMTLVLSGDARSPFAAIDVMCNLVSACARVGDLARADEWTRTVDDYLGLGIDQGPTFMYVHCRTNLGMILCDNGRWAAAEATLQLASSRGPRAGLRTDGQVRAALAELRLAQGRLADAERLLAGRREHPDCALPFAGLRLAQGAYGDAVEAARHAVHRMGEDRMRASRLLAICVEAELRRNAVADAEAAAAELDALVDGNQIPVLRARAALCRGRVNDARGLHTEAAAVFAAGLRALGDDGWPLLRAELHLALAGVLAAVDQTGAISAARAAHLIYEPLGAPAAADSARLLNSLGVAATARTRAADATAALTRREREVLAALREGLSNAEIATRHHNSVRTIEHHVSAILAKLGLRSRAEAAAYAACLEIEYRLSTASHPGPTHPVI